MPQDNPLAAIEPEFTKIALRCADYTSVDVERLYALYKGVLYVIEQGVPGALVECGVWKGGCCMLMALTAIARGQGDRDIYLYDTFTGMAEPGAEDVDHAGQPAAPQWRQRQTATHNQWCFAGLDEVKQNLLSTGYDPARLHFIQGKVEDTIPGPAGATPAEIALLRLDTDWYESSYHELVHLFPRLRPNGILILDDFFYWQGQRKATERYFNERGINMEFTRTTTGAIGVKPAALDVITGAMGLAPRPQPEVRALPSRLPATV